MFHAVVSCAVRCESRAVMAKFFLQSVAFRVSSSCNLPVEQRLAIRRLSRSMPCHQGLLGSLALKNSSIEGQGLSERCDNFIDQIRLCAELPFLLLGYFDPQKRRFADFCYSAEPNLTLAQCRGFVETAERRLAVFAAALASEDQAGGCFTDGASEQPYPVWLQGAGCVVGLGKPVAWIYPVIGYRADDRARNPLDPKLEKIAFTYVTQCLAKASYGTKTWSQALVETTLLVLSIEFFLVKADGEIVVDGRTSRREDDGWIVLNNRLTLADPREQAALRQAIHDAAAPPHSASIISVTTAQGSVRLAAVAQVDAADEGLAVVLFETRNTDHQALRSHFFRAHGLTRSESLIANSLLDGKTLAEAAVANNYALETARSYLKHVFSKTGTHRQSELISLYYASILPIGKVIARSDADRARDDGRSAYAQTAYSLRN
jgi:DNA-binding CsgD family transcriptional regulator